MWGGATVTSHLLDSKVTNIHHSCYLLCWGKRWRTGAASSDVVVELLKKFKQREKKSGKWDRISEIGRLKLN